MLLSASYSRCRRIFKFEIYEIIFSADTLPELIKIQGRRSAQMFPCHSAVNKVL